ncbi:hypothetical protein [Variovorax sp. GT1P44]|uniref:hypothetical protein n=1 Tax=Variovorax sp. GT1P44 TaxID=3443742 RepID=UPI003F48A6AC
MDELPPALPHGELEEVFPDVFFVTGTMKTVLMGAPWHFSRNMTVVRDGDALTLINPVRLDDAGLARLDSLGRVVNVVQIGALHDEDNAFYQQRYGATFWAPPGTTHGHGLQVDKPLVPGGEVPFPGCSVFAFDTTKLPESIIRIDRAGGILVACDALQNWVEPNEYFSDGSREMMAGMGFFQPANFGPLFLQVNEPKGEDYARLRALPFRHALCGHGSPLRDTAAEAYAERTRQVFGI